MTQASVLQTIQLGLESTPGVIVPANRKLGSLSIEPALQTEIDPFTPSGQKYAAFTALNREWVSASLSGRPTYTELPLILSSIIGKATPATNEGVTEWTFESSSDDADAPQTFTIEQVGTNGVAARFAYGLVTDFNMDVSRNSTDLGGTMLAQQYTSDITPTADPTSLALVPILPSQFSVYLDTDAEDVGTTKLLRDFVANLSIGGKFGPIWALDRAQGSYAGHVDLEPTVTLTLQMERNEVGFTPLAALREGSTMYIRVEAIGPEIGETGQNYASVLDFAGQVSATSFGDTDGLAVVDWTFTAVNDADLGPFTWTVTNGIASY